MLRANRVKTCKVCKVEYKAWTTHAQMNRLCSPDCAAKYALSKRQEVQRKDARKARIAYTRDNEKLSAVRARAQSSFNRYIRERDYLMPCMACGKHWSGDVVKGSGWDAGHFRSRGSAPHLRFHLLNCWKVCTRCNRDLSGNIVEMRKGMLSRLGEDRVKALEYDNTDRNYTRDDLRRIQRIFSKRARLYKRLREAR